MDNKLKTVYTETLMSTPINEVMFMADVLIPWWHIRQSNSSRSAAYRKEEYSI